MAEDATLKLPKDLIDSIVKVQVSQAMTDALGGSDQIIKELVHQVLNVSVDRDGKACNYSGSMPYITYLMQKSLTESIKAILMEELEKHEKAIRAAIAAELGKKNSPLVKQLVEGMSTGLLASVSDRYRFTCNVDVR